ncbi:MAG: alpha/beta fold hydrolase [Magnetococcales bacterium]|nr:alpha/beta fold hydrolase [Magnetococcales bacterium]
MIGVVWVGLLGCALPARADVMVLVHGYFSDDKSWDQSGITAALQTAGWWDGGGVSTEGGLIQERVQIPAPGHPTFYRADLPSEAPVDLQARLLKLIVDRIFAKHPGEKRILVGHSAGGVVARLLMVLHPALDIQLLVTIAAPHLGTDKAEVALMVGSTPLGMIAPMFGADTLNRSQRLYADLVREQPGNFLYRLNHRRHPRARYVSVVRKEDTALSGDMTVPAWSQDLRHVAALNGQAESITVVAGHALGRVDGQTLVHILR